MVQVMVIQALEAQALVDKALVDKASEALALVDKALEVAKTVNQPQTQTPNQAHSAITVSLIICSVPKII